MNNQLQSREQYQDVPEPVKRRAQVERTAARLVEEALAIDRVVHAIIERSRNPAPAQSESQPPQSETPTDTTPPTTQDPEVLRAYIDMIGNQHDS
ncbi:MAG: hypothetical protein JWS12_900 [Candidatus Saccharibacteria bacterium]|nr:hypothetical protein [Candidatus Saccharibacteria bacterium]